MDNPFEKKDVKEVLKDRRKVEMVRQFMKRSSQYREPYLELARKSRELYENWYQKSRSPIQRANLQLPFAYTIIETEVPQILNIFFRDDEVIRFEGRGPEDARWENLLTEFHKQQLSEANFKIKTAVFIKNMLLDGTAIAKLPYRFQEVETAQTVTEINPQTGEPVVRKLPSKEVAFDGPDVEIIPFQDFFPDWSVRVPGDIQSMRGVVHRTWKTLASLRSSGKYKNLKELELSFSLKGSNAWGPAYYESEEGELLENLNDRIPGIKREGQVEIWEYWGLYDPNGDGNFKEYIITIANGDVVIRAEENFYDAKFKPFVACPNIVREAEFYGIPEVIALRPLIKEANALRNARLDNINLSVNPMWIIDRSAGINHRSLYSRPNGIIWTNDINGIRPIQIPDPSIGSLAETNNLAQDIQNASGLLAGPAIANSTGRAFARSATGVAFIQNFANSRIGIKAFFLSDLYFKEVGKILLKTNRQFVTAQRWVRVMGDDENPFQLLPPDAFHRNYDFKITTDFENGGVEGALRKMQLVAQAAAQFEQSQPGVLKMDVILKELLRPILGRQLSRFVRSDEERAQLQAQELAARQAVQAEIGRNARQPLEVVPPLPEEEQ